jgi:hypothetical protein
MTPSCGAAPCRCAVGTGLNAPEGFGTAIATETPTRPAVNASKEPIKRGPKNQAGSLSTTVGGTQQPGHNEDKRRNMSTESLD